MITPHSCGFVIAWAYNVESRLRAFCLLAGLSILESTFEMVEELISATGISWSGAEHVPHVAVEGSRLRSVLSCPLLLFV